MFETLPPTRFRPPHVPCRLVLGRLFLLFLLVPIVELMLLLRVGEALGPLPTFALIVVTALTGSWLARREGASAFRAVKRKMASGAMPNDELTDGLIILVAGVLLLTPGVLTDLVGILGLLPPSRALMRKQIQKRLKEAMHAGSVRFSVFPGSRGGVDSSPPPPGRHRDPPPRMSSVPDQNVEEATIIEETDER